MESEEKNEIVEEVKSKIIEWCRGWLTLIFGGFSLLTLIALYQIYHLTINKSAEIITNQITEKFSEDHISKTFTDVAENQAKQIIENSLNPAIAKAVTSIDTNLETFDVKIKETNTQYDLELKSLKNEVAYFKERTNILKLGDKAIATGLAEPFDKLTSIIKLSENDELKMIAIAEVYRILSHLSLVQQPSLSKGFGYEKSGTDEFFFIKDMKTSAMIDLLSKEQGGASYIIRAKLVALLATKREKGVIEVLFNVIENDSHLTVRYNALNSFEKLTGFRNPMNEVTNMGIIKNDLLHIDFTRRSYQANKNKWEKTFSEMK